MYHKKHTNNEQKGNKELGNNGKVASFVVGKVFSHKSQKLNMEGGLLFDVTVCISYHLLQIIFEVSDLINFN